MSREIAIFQTLHSFFCKRKRTDNRVGSLITLNSLLIDRIDPLSIGEVVFISIVFLFLSYDLPFISILPYERNNANLLFIKEKWRSLYLDKMYIAI